MKPHDTKAHPLDADRREFCGKLTRHASNAENSAESGVGGVSRRVLAELRRGGDQRVVAHLFNPRSVGTPALDDPDEIEVRSMIAVLFAHHKARATTTRLNFGGTMKYLADKGAAEPVERRFLRLIGANCHQYPDVLRQCVLLAGSHNVAINWFQLLRDSHALMFGDDAPRKAVIRQWCQGFYTDRKSDSATSDLS